MDAYVSSLRCVAAPLAVYCSATETTYSMFFSKDKVNVSHESDYAI